MAESRERIDDEWGRLGAQLKEASPASYDELTIHLRKAIAAHQAAAHLREHGTLLQRLLLLPTPTKAA